MPLLKTLLLRKEVIGSALILLLSFFLYKSRLQIRQLETEKASRPSVAAVVKTDKIEERGRVKTTKKFLPPASPGAKPVLAEVIIEKEPSVITTIKESEKSESHGVPQFPKWVIGTNFSALDAPGNIGVRFGRTFDNRLDITLGYSMYGSARDRIRIDAAIRF